MCSSLVLCPCVDRNCAPLPHIACNLAYAHSLQVVPSAASREQRTQCLRGRTCDPSDQLTNDWSVRTEKTANFEVIPQHKFPLAGSGRAGDKLVSGVSWRNFPVMDSCPSSLVLLRRVYSTSIVTSYPHRLSDCHKAAGHNPGTGNQQRHSSAICRCRIDSKRRYGLPLPASKRMVNGDSSQRQRVVISVKGQCF